MPISDPIKKSIAMHSLLYYKICYKCRSKNPSSAKRCRKCGRRNLRWKKREITK